MCDINELVQDSVKLADVDARIHDISIELELDSPLPEIFVDPIQIQQVILNLIRNAVDATEQGARGPRAIRTRTGRTDVGIEVSVKDNGTGISPEAEEKLFSPFFTTKQSGMGMGLSISHSIIGAHGGRLWFTRNPNGGATFHFTLPAAGGADHG
jgi:signal transduction histidine kinase